MSEMLEQAIKVIKLGDKETGQRLLSEILRANPKEEKAWLWMSAVEDSDERQRECLMRVLAINPENTVALRGLQQIAKSSSAMSFVFPQGSAADQNLAEPGFLYVLINPSMDGLVKIGKTTRDPEDRIKELSSPTGVPTPFQLAYKVAFSNCTWAEEYVHTRLEQRNYRVSNNREFFKAPLNVAIEVILEAQRASLHSSRIGDGKDSRHAYSQADIDVSPTWASVYEMADASYHGLGDTLQDYREALNLYKQAAKLGCPYAFWQIGTMYSAGEGCERDATMAFEYFREGGSHGDHRCWAEMAIYYYSQRQHENARKCWNKYFEGSQPSNHAFAEGPQLRIFYGLKFVESERISGLKAYGQKLSDIKDELVMECDTKVTYAKDWGEQDHYRTIKMLIEQHL